MALGVVLYVGYRRSQGKSLRRRLTVPEGALTPRPRRGRVRLDPRAGASARALDDDIMQTAGRLAAEEDDDEGEGGAEIEAIWVFVVPMSLPIDGRVARRPSSSARAPALARAKAVGEEYEGVEVATVTVRARRAGEAIVREAAAPRRRGDRHGRRGADPRMRGGVLLGGLRRAARHLRRGDDPLRGQQGALPRDPHRAPPRRQEVRSRRRPRRTTRRCPTIPPCRPRRRMTAASPARSGGAAPSSDRLESAPCSCWSSERAGSGPRSQPLRCARATTSRSSTRTRSPTSGSTSSWARPGRRPAGASRSARRSRWTRSSRPASRRPTSSSPPPTATTPTSSSPSSPSAASTCRR